MEKIHAIEADGRILTGIEVFRRLYQEVGEYLAHSHNQYTGAATCGVVLQSARLRLDRTTQRPLLPACCMPLAITNRKRH